MCFSPKSKHAAEDVQAAELWVYLARRPPANRRPKRFSVLVITFAFLTGEYRLSFSRGSAHAERHNQKASIDLNRLAAAAMAPLRC
jgi:hypothetical protein